MFHTIYIVTLVADNDHEIYSNTTALNHKDIAEELVSKHKDTWGKRVIHCGITEHQIFIG